MKVSLTITCTNLQIEQNSRGIRAELDNVSLTHLVEHLADAELDELLKVAGAEQSEREAIAST